MALQQVELTHVARAVHVAKFSQQRLLTGGEDFRIVNECRREHQRREITVDVRPVGTVDVHPADVTSFLAAEINRFQRLADDCVRFRRQLVGCTQRQQNPGCRDSTFLVLLPPSAYVGQHTPALFLNFLVNLGNLLRVAGKEPLDL